jgi:hypothetical protein
MCVRSLVTANKECQTGAKSCKAGKAAYAHRITRSQWASVNIAPAARISETEIGVQMNASFSQAARRCLIGITKQ